MTSGALTKSAVIRLARTVLQGLLSYVTVEMVTNWVLDLNLDSDVKTLITVVVTALYSFLQRRFLDPSSIPSLVDTEAAAGTEYEGRRVAGDGKGLT